MRKNRYRRGVTLLEMMIVLSLAIVLVGIAATYNKGIAQQIIIEREHATAFSTFIKARSAGLTVPKGDVGELVCGYGVHVDAASRTFTYFKDLGNFATKSCAPADANKRYDTGEELERKILSDAVTVASTISDIVYVPPFGKTFIDGVEAQASASVVITSPAAETSKGIRANAFGQVTEFQPPTP